MISPKSDLLYSGRSSSDIRDLAFLDETRGVPAMSGLCLVKTHLARKSSGGPFWHRTGGKVIIDATKPPLCAGKRRGCRSSG
jgi:hypothetical protein